jgi:hypothetical protein
MVIKRFSNILGNKKLPSNPFRNNGGSSSDAARTGPISDDEAIPELDTPEANAGRGVVGHLEAPLRAGQCANAPNRDFSANLVGRITRYIHTRKGDVLLDYILTSSAG